MGIATSAIPASSEEEEEDEYDATPLDELIPVLMDTYLNADILGVLHEWSLTREFYRFLGTNSSFWKYRDKFRKEVVRTRNILQLSYWQKFPKIREVIIFIGNEPFIPTNRIFIDNRLISIPSLTLITNNQSAINFLVSKYSLTDIVLRLEFILDDFSYLDLTYLGDDVDDYYWVKTDLLRNFTRNFPKELEIIVIDNRKNHYGERFYPGKINRSQVIHKNPVRPFLPVKRRLHFY